jgi:hypothetical protein
MTLTGFKPIVQGKKLLISRLSHHQLQIGALTIFEACHQSALLCEDSTKWTGSASQITE